MIKMVDDESKILGVEQWKLKLVWLPALVGAIFLMSINMLLMPRIDEIKQFQVDSATAKKKAADYDQKRNYLLSADEEDIKAKEGLLVQALPGRKDVYYLLTVVQNLASEYGYSVKSFSVSPGKIDNSTSKKPSSQPKNTALTRIPVIISLSGSKEQFLPLIDGIERSLPILSIGSFKMTQNGGVISLDLSVTTSFSSDIFDVKVANLTLADLTLTKDEVATLNTLSTFKLRSDATSLLSTESAKAFVPYNRNDPFNF